MAQRDLTAVGPPWALNLLLIEDHAADARLVWEMLRDGCGSSVRLAHARSLAEGLACLEIAHVDLVLLDLGLPDSQGLDTLLRVQEQVPAVPVVVLSGREDAALALRTVHAGAQDYLVKGRISAQVLGRVVRYAVQRANLLRQERAARAEAEAAQARLEAVMEAQRTFLSAVSHDLRNPLAAILGRAEMLRAHLEEGVAPNTLGHGLERIEANASRMLALLDELVDLAHLDVGRPLPLLYTPTDLVTLVEQGVADHQARVSGHTLRLDAHVPTLSGSWDERRLRRVLDNLFDNARKYSPAESEVRVVLQEADGWALLAVADQGIGIPADDLPHVFERFRRARNVNGQAGAGLGLWGSKQIVEQHGGTIAIHSEEGVGTTVTVRLPLLP